MAAKTKNATSTPYARAMGPQKADASAPSPAQIPK